MNVLNNRKGVTLLELVVVIVVIGILMMLIVPRVGAYQASAARQTCLGNQRILSSSQAIYFATYGKTAKTVKELQDAKLVDRVMCPSATAGTAADSCYKVDDSDGYIWRCLININNHVEAPAATPTPTLTPTLTPTP